MKVFYRVSLTLGAIILIAFLVGCAVSKTGSMVGSASGGGGSSLLELNPISDAIFEVGVYKADESQAVVYAGGEDNFFSTFGMNGKRQENFKDILEEVGLSDYKVYAFDFFKDSAGNENVLMGLRNPVNNGSALAKFTFYVAGGVSGLSSVQGNVKVVDAETDSEIKLDDKYVMKLTVSYSEHGVNTCVNTNQCFAAVVGSIVVGDTDNLDKGFIFIHHNGEPSVPDEWYRPKLNEEGVDWSSFPAPLHALWLVDHEEYYLLVIFKLQNYKIYHYEPSTKTLTLKFSEDLGVVGLGYGAVTYDTSTETTRLPALIGELGGVIYLGGDPEHPEQSVIDGLPTNVYYLHGYIVDDTGIYVGVDDSMTVRVFRIDMITKTGEELPLNGIDNPLVDWKPYGAVILPSHKNAFFIGLSGPTELPTSGLILFSTDGGNSFDLIDRDDL